MEDAFVRSSIWAIIAKSTQTIQVLVAPDSSVSAIRYLLTFELNLTAILEYRDVHTRCLRHNFLTDYDRRPNCLDVLAYETSYANKIPESPVRSIECL
jgi:hypothetical protein